MAARVPPHNLEAEESLLGAMLLSRDAAERALDTLNPEDFYRVAHSHIFRAIGVLYERGEPTDAVMVAEELDRRGVMKIVGDPSVLIALQSNTPSTGHAADYARIVEEHALLRRTIAMAEEVIDIAYHVPDDPTSMMEQATSDIVTVASSLDVVQTKQLSMTMDDFLDDAPNMAPWVIPDLIRQDWHLIVTAPEGAGKAVLMRSMAMSAAQGLHPFRHNDIDPIRTLIVDLENPAQAIYETASILRTTLATYSHEYHPDNCRIWSKRGGMNVRNRRDRSALRREIAKYRPKLVCIGPLYKMQIRERGESYEQVAAEVIMILDDLRTKYDFALIIEAHAAKGGGGAEKRPLWPMGSELWTASPDIGIGLRPTANPRDIQGEETDLTVERWRGDRMKNTWPKRIERDPHWLISGVY